MGTHQNKPQQGDSNEYPQHMFLWRTDKNCPSIIIKYPPIVAYFGRQVFLRCYSFDAISGVLHLESM